MRTTKTLIILVVVCALSASLSLAQAQTAKTAAGQPLKAQEAFARLRTLCGEWQGVGMAKGQSVPAHVSYKLTAAGNALVETLFPGTPHEMMTVYHLDGAKLMLTHYCSLGNQPRMVLDPASSLDHLSFVFAGGTNMDPERDMHMHNVRIRIKDADHIESEWDTYQGAKFMDTKKFALTRQK